jgi:hypothetical protein
LAVPIGQLQQDDSVTPSPKATDTQMRAYMAEVPAVYEKLAAGATAADFQKMRTGSDARTRAVGDTYHHLFSPAGIDHRIEADQIEGRGLVVTRGRHRVEAARELGLPYLPVHVRAADDRILDASTRKFEATLGTTNPNVVRAQRNLDVEHRAARAERERTTSQPSVNHEPMDRAARSVRAPGERSRSGPTRDRSR